MPHRGRSSLSHHLDIFVILVTSLFCVAYPPVIAFSHYTQTALRLLSFTLGFMSRRGDLNFRVNYVSLAKRFENIKHLDAVQDEALLASAHFDKLPYIESFKLRRVPGRA